MSIAVVTGASGAVGSAVCKLLISNGFEVIGLGRKKVAPALPGVVRYLGGIDLSKVESADSVIQAIGWAKDSIDLLVNVAGGFVWEQIEGGSVESWDAMYQINVMTTLNACRAVVPLLRDNGAIVNLGAAAAEHAAEGMGAYAASKAAVIKLNEALCAELAPRGIRVNVISPTIVDTVANRRDMPDANFGEWVKPEQVAEMVCFLASDQSQAINNQNIVLSG